MAVAAKASSPKTSPVRRLPPAPDIPKIERRIRRILEQHPEITASMIGSHIRPYYRDWRMVLEAMIDREEVERVVRTNVTQTGVRRTSYVFKLSPITD